MTKTVIILKFARGKKKDMNNFVHLLEYASGIDKVGQGLVELAFMRNSKGFQRLFRYFL